MNAGDERNGTSKFSGSITLRMDEWACSHRVLKGFHIDCGSAVEIVFWAYSRRSFRNDFFWAAYQPHQRLHTKIVDNFRQPWVIHSLASNFLTVKSIHLKLLANCLFRHPRVIHCLAGELLDPNNEGSSCSSSQRKLIAIIIRYKIFYRLSK